MDTRAFQTWTLADKKDISCLRHSRPNKRPKVHFNGMKNYSIGSRVTDALAYRINLPLGFFVERREDKRDDLTPGGTSRRQLEAGRFPPGP